MVKLLEYEAKELLKDAGIPVPSGVLVQASSTSSLEALPLPAVLKVQIPVGGRAKAGGIKVVSVLDDVAATAKQLLSTEVLGYRPRALLAEEQLTAAAELYISFAIDRTLQSAILLAHGTGGVDIERSAQAEAARLLRLPLTGAPSEDDARAVLHHVGLHSKQLPLLYDLLVKLWRVFEANDCLLLEINPLIVTSSDQLVCADAKIELDDTAAFRHSDRRFRESAENSQFVLLDKDGTIASMANGAGLAMATVDAIKAAGALPANFLDIGGGTTTESMVAAFRSVVALGSVRAVVINVFAGITRCDEVAEAIIIARDEFDGLPPLFIRLAGTHAQLGKSVLERRGIATLPTLEECVAQAVRVVRHV